MRFKSLLVLVIFLLLAQISFALTVSELIENAKQYDGEEIVIKGEAIGDIMKRGKNGWVNISDGNNAIGIWAPMPILNQITFLGSYKHKGDQVKVTGTFKEASEKHGGDMCIDAYDLTVTNVGAKTEHPFEQWKLVVIFILFGLLIVLLVLRYRALIRK